MRGRINGSINKFPERWRGNGEPTFAAKRFSSKAAEEPHHLLEERIMLGWAITFLIVALVAALFGFGGIAAVAVDAAKIIFFVAIILFVVSAVVMLIRGRSPTLP